MVGVPGRWLPLISLAAILLSLCLGGCEKPKPPPLVLEPLTICLSSTMLLPLVVAEQRGFFAEQGLAVATKEFVVGREALEGMLRGDCDLGTAAETPVAEYALQRDDFRIIGAMQSSDNLSRIVARLDRGITNPTDLRGRRIATVKGTAPHYFLKIFLEKHGLAMREVEVSFLKGNEQLPALVNGTVDAIAMTNLVVGQALQALGEKAVLLEAPGLCRNYYMLLATTELLARRPEIATKVLRALAQAEELINRKPEEAQAMASSYQKMSLAEIKQLWGMYDHRLSLEYPMLLGLEANALWCRQQQGLDLPDRDSPRLRLDNLIEAQPLRVVRPEAINLNR